MTCRVNVGMMKNEGPFQNAHRRLVTREIERVCRSNQVLSSERLPDGAIRLHLSVERPNEIFDILGNVIFATCQVQSVPELCR
jgi:hypothetical protein